MLHSLRGRAVVIDGWLSAFIVAMPRDEDEDVPGVCSPALGYACHRDD